MKVLLSLALGLAMTCASAVRAANPVIIIETSMGNIKCELFEDKAPVTVKNILSYVDDKFYDGTIFHRVMGRENSGKDFMVQCGGFEPGMKEKKNTKGNIKNESDNGLKNQRGTLAMARTPQPHSASSQFFINVADNAFLDKERAADKFGYCVFGKVIEGQDVVDKIKAVKTTTKGGHENVPVDDVVVKSVKRQTEASKQP